MPFAPKTRLGAYEILGSLGAGGMGEVYRARDTRLGRDVALKVLPPHLASDGEARARLAREARAVASLGHPHICALYDVGSDGGVDFLVFELLDGETLETRLARGPLALEQVLKLATELADALSQAHRKRLVHRDIKPGNIMLTKKGAKLLDFGIAWISAPGPPSAGEDETTSAPLTAKGVIPGTLPYMAPEQVEGNPADERSDIWSLGATLYEAATGRRAFEGTTRVAVMASILKSDPPSMDGLRPEIPVELRRLIEMCLVKDPDQRLQRVHDLLLALRWAAETRSAEFGEKRKGPRSHLGPRLALASVALAVGTSIGLLWGGALKNAQRDAAVWLSIPAPTNGRFGSSSTTQISPDGRTLAFVLDQALWIRPLASRTARVLRGAEGAASIFWSPDSRRIGFFARGKLLTIALDGSPPRELCEASDARGGTWSRRGVILFAPISEGPLYWVRETGGSPAVATQLDTTRHQVAHRWPAFLPDGEHFLYAALPMRHGAYESFVGSLDSGTPESLMLSGCAPIFAPPSSVIFLRGESLVAQRVDLGTRRLTGGSVTICDPAFSIGQLGEPMASASSTGMLAIHPDLAARVSIRFSDRSGTLEPSLMTLAGLTGGPAISPNGTMAAVSLWRGPRRDADLWLLDLRRLTSLRMTHVPGIAINPVWSKDGTRMVYRVSQGGTYDFYLKRIDDPDHEELVYHSGAFLARIADWSPDGRFVVFDNVEPGNATDIWLLPIGSDPTPVAFKRTPADEHAGAISPDGKWLAYASNEPGSWGIYVESFPTPGDKYLASPDRSFQMWWTRGGRELVYVVDHDVMSVDVTPGPTPRFGKPRRLFRNPGDTRSWAGPDDRRFLATNGEDPSTTPAIQIVEHWAAIAP